ncbi:MAG: XTP/dITP diphosphatase [Culicoidibacterales bacterium]
MKQIILATNNHHKLSEFRAMCEPLGIHVLSLKDLNIIVEIDETGATFAENAIIKAETIAKLTQLPVFADDSGLAVDALDGAPGVHSARFAGTHGDDAANNAKLLLELVATPLAQRTARFVCVIAYAQPGQSTQTFTGTCEGTIAFNTGGESGFGYDPLFIPSGFTQTFAQLSAAEKNQISHRARALEQLQTVL